MFTSIIDKISEEGLDLLSEYDWIGSSIFWIVTSFITLNLILLIPLIKMDKNEIIK